MKNIPYNKEGNYIITRSFLDSLPLEFEPIYPNVMVSAKRSREGNDPSFQDLDDLDGNWELIAQSCNDTMIFWTWKFCLWK